MTAKDVLKDVLRMVYRAIRAAGNRSGITIR